MNKCKKFLSLLFTLTFLCGLFSLSVSAAEPEIEWLIPQKLKIGDSVGNNIANGKNLPPIGQFWATTPESHSLHNLFGHCYDHSFPLRSKAPKGMKPRHL